MFKYREGSAIYGSKKRSINTRGLEATGVVDKPKALPSWLIVNLRKLVELYIKVSVIVQKRAPGINKGFLNPIQK